jgi:hypothetical protein
MQKKFCAHVWVMHNLSPDVLHTHLPDDMISVLSLLAGKHASHFFSFCKVVATYRKISSITWWSLSLSAGSRRYATKQLWNISRVMQVLLILEQLDLTRLCNGKKSICKCMWWQKKLKCLKWIMFLTFRILCNGCKIHALCLWEVRFVVILRGTTELLCLV